MCYELDPATQQSAKCSLTARWNSFHFTVPPQTLAPLSPSSPFTSLAERCQKALHVAQLGLPCINPTTHLRGAATRKRVSG